MKMRLLLLPFVFMALVGCAVNPVTGKNEFNLVSEQQELAIGAKQFAPARQAQGGDYVVDKELTAYVNQVGQRLAAVSDRRLPYEFKVLNNSTPNAWAMPGGKIAINRGLLTELDNEAELAAVLGHEIVHAAARHTAHRMSTGMLLQAGVLGASLATQGESYGQLAQIGAGLGAQLVSQKYGRDDEREADRYGMKYMVRAGYNPQGAVDLQKKFVALSEGRRQDWLSGLFASHPPSRERVQNNIALLSQFPKGGEMGVKRWQAKTKHLMKTKPAYEAYDKGRKALSNNDLRTAKRLTNKALSIEPNEALFHGLQGDIAQVQQNPRTAITHYSKAAKLNPDFFYPYLQRGRAYQSLNQRRRAAADFKRSFQLLPTAVAQKALGTLALQEGDRQAAIAHYSKVAGQKSPIGREAYAALVDLDFNQNPRNYLQVRSGRDRRGRVVAQVINPTPRNVGQVALDVRYRSASGQVRGGTLHLPGIVKAGSKKVFPLSLGARLSDQELRTLNVRLAGARLAR